MPATRISGQDVRNASITDADVATANKDGAQATPSLRTLSATTPAEIEFAGAGSAGSSQVASPANHVHPIDALSWMKKLLGSLYKAAVLALNPICYWRLGERDHYYMAVRRSVPVSYWALGEATPGTGTAVDEMGANHATYVASPTGGVKGAIPTDPNTAVTFNGSTQYARKATSSTLDATTIVSVEAWVKAAAPFAADGTFFSKRSGAAGGYLRGFQMGAMATTGYPYLFGGDGTHYGLPSAPVNVCDGTWHHVVGVRDGDAGYIYIDGVQQDYNATAFSGVGSMSGAGADEACIGAWVAGSANWFPGTIDEVAIYTRALGAAEVAVHYATKHGPAPSYAVEDHSGHGHTGAYGGYPAIGVVGALTSDNDTAATFVRASSQKVTTAAPVTTAVDNWTLAAWVKPTASATTRCILYNGNQGAATNGYGFYMTADNHVWVYAQSVGQLSSGTTGSILPTSGYSFVVVVRRSGTTYIYINGALDETGNTSTPLAPTTLTSVSGAGSNEFDGTIDEAAIWDRALTAQEIADLYAIGTLSY